MAGDSAAIDRAASQRMPGRGSAAVAWLTDPKLLAAALAPLVGATVSLVLFLPTLMPGVANWDTAEFQTVGPVLGTAHPTGYASYVVLGWLGVDRAPAFRRPGLPDEPAPGDHRRGRGRGHHRHRPGPYRPSFRRARGGGCCWPGRQLFWQFSTHADPRHVPSGPHRPHLHDAAGLGAPPPLRRSGGYDRGDRWLVAAAIVVRRGLANHSLVMLLAPAIGLFVLSVDCRESSSVGASWPSAPPRSA